MNIYSISYNILTIGLHAELIKNICAILMRNTQGDNIIKIVRFKNNQILGSNRMNGAQGYGFKRLSAYRLSRPTEY